LVGGMHHSTCVDSTPAGPCRSPRQAGRAYCRGQEGHRWHLRKVRKKVASSKQFIATRDRRDTPNAKKFLVEAVRYLGTIRWVPSLLNNLAPADAERRKPRWSPRSKRGFILRMGGPRLGWRCLVQRNAGTARPSAYSGQSRHLVCECEIFSLMWHAPGRGSQSKQRNGGRRTDP
jgi:hypothetical protein